jgi:hypothetical protein
MYSEPTNSGRVPGTGGFKVGSAGFCLESLMKEGNGWYNIQGLIEQGSEN